MFIHVPVSQSQLSSAFAFYGKYKMDLTTNNIYPHGAYHGGTYWTARSNENLSKYVFVLHAVLAAIIAPAYDPKKLIFEIKGVQFPAVAVDVDLTGIIFSGVDFTMSNLNYSVFSDNNQFNNCDFPKKGTFVSFGGSGHVEDWVTQPIIQKAIRCTEERENVEHIPLKRRAVTLLETWGLKELKSKKESENGAPVSAARVR